MSNVVNLGHRELISFTVASVVCFYGMNENILQMWLPWNSNIAPMLCFYWADFR